MEMWPGLQWRSHGMEAVKHESGS